MRSAGPILIVDDEADLRNLLKIALTRAGFETVMAATGAEALALAARCPPQLVLLDMMLPDVSGREVCRQLRAEPITRDIPIIILSAKGEESDRVVGFEAGADDYVVKSSFSVRELVLRVKAVLRRQGGAPAESSVQVFGPIRVDTDAHRVWLAGQELELTATEFQLLLTLAVRVGRVQTRGVLLQDVWGLVSQTNTRTVDTHVKRLREKLGTHAQLIETVRGVGYRFCVN